LPSPPQPAGCVTATPLLLLLFENLLRHFQNTDSVGTEPKEAAYAITGENADNSPRKIINIELSDFGRIIDNSEVILIIHHSPLPSHHCPQGTGSCPWLPQGLQRAIRFAVSHRPFKGPYFRRASIPYCEQVGVYLHWLPSHGEMISWYNFIRAMNGRLRIAPACCKREGLFFFIGQFQ
jgi:hypothetical protein